MEQEELFIPKTKNKVLKIILAILLIVGLGIGAYLLYQYKFNNPKVTISNALENARSNIKESFKEVNQKGIYKVNGHIKVDSNLNSGEISEILKILKDLELQFGGELDSKNLVANFTLNSKYKNDKLVDIKGYFENNTIYLLLDGLYDKYIKFDTKQTEMTLPSLSNLEINPSDIETILDSLLTAAKKEFTELDIKKSDTKITIDNKEIEVIDNSIVLENNEVNTLAKNIIIDLKGDQKFLDVLKKITGKDAKETLSEMETGISSSAFKGTYTINFYTDKGLFNKKIISVKQSITQNDMTTSIIVDKISNDEIMISLLIPNTQYSIKIKKNNSVMNMVLGMSSMGSYINIELNANYEAIKEVTKLDVSNSKNVKDLTEEDEQIINNKLKDNQALIKLIEEITKINTKRA